MVYAGGRRLTLSQKAGLQVRGGGTLTTGAWRAPSTWEPPQHTHSTRGPGHGQPSCQGGQIADRSGDVVVVWCGGMVASWWSHLVVLHSKVGVCQSVREQAQVVVGQDAAPQSVAVRTRVPAGAATRGLVLVHLA